MTRHETHSQRSIIEDENNFVVIERNGIEESSSRSSAFVGQTRRRHRDSSMSNARLSSPLSFVTVARAQHPVLEIRHSVSDITEDWGETGNNRSITQRGKSTMAPEKASGAANNSDSENQESSHQLLREQEGQSDEEPVAIAEQNESEQQQYQQLQAGQQEQQHEQQPEEEQMQERQSFPFNLQNFQQQHNPEEGFVQQPAFPQLQQQDLTGLEGFMFDASSSLGRYCELEQWPQALVRLGLHPNEASQMDADKNLPLHIACRNGAPAIFLKTLAASYPDALTHQDEADGMTPLHITCGCNDVDLQKVRALLHYSPSVGQEECQSIDQDGDTPLHAACRASAPLDVIKQLIDVYPGALHVRDQEGLTPLLRLWVRAFVMYGEENLTTIRSKYDFTEELQQIWEKTYVCLVGLSYGRSTLPEGIDFFMVHQSACYDCPRVVIEIALRLYPETIMKTEMFGGSVLGMAINRRMFRARNLSEDESGAVVVRSSDNSNGEERRGEVGGLVNHANCDEDDDDDLNVLCYRNSETGVLQKRLVPSVIEILLNAEPKLLDLCEQEGVSPLHSALRSGKAWTDGISAIVKHRPDSLCEPDPNTELWPFMMPAFCFEKRSQRTRVNTIFELLRRAPHLIEAGVPKFVTGTKRGYDCTETDGTCSASGFPSMPSENMKRQRNVEHDAYLVNPWSDVPDAKAQGGNPWQDTSEDHHEEVNPWLAEKEEAEENPWLTETEELEDEA